MSIRERSRGPAEIRPAVLRSCFAGSAREEHRETTVDDPQRLAVIARHRARYAERKVGRRQLLQELVLKPRRAGSTTFE
jgi:hypothetical protein